MSTKKHHNTKLEAAKAKLRQLAKESEGRAGQIEHTEDSLEDNSPADHKAF